MGDVLLALAALRERILRLGSDLPGSPRLGDKLRRTFGTVRRGLPAAPLLDALDADLDAAGLHSLADARFLASFSPEKGAIRRFGSRGRAAREELEAALAGVERRSRLSGLPAAADSTRLLSRHGRVARAERLVLALAGEEVDGDPFEPLRREKERLPPRDPRLAAAELLAHRAREELIDLAARRRDLDAAREVLLAIGEAGERERYRELCADVARLRAELPRGETSGSFPARIAAAASAGDAPRLYLELRALYLASTEGGSPALASAARRALEPFARAAGPDQGASGAERLLGSLGPGPLHELLVRHYPRLGSGAVPERQEALLSLASDLAVGRWELLPLAIGAGRFFDPSDNAGAVEEAVERRKVASEVPTGEMTLDYASSIDQLPGFVIGDPRTVLYDLASGRQLVRGYARTEEVQRTVRRGTVRVYACDASGSMRGQRARFRDALLCAELHNLHAARDRGEEAVDALYWFTFNDLCTPLTRVSSGAGALEEIEKLCAEHVAGGGTDITHALEHACLAIRDARGKDPQLARATVVLVTDGDDRVDLARVREALSGAGLGLWLSVSVVSVQLDNPDLSRLVEEQRRAGRRAFYRHVTDSELLALATDLDRAPRTVLPAIPPGGIDPAGAELKEALAALSAAARSSPPRQRSPLRELDRWYPERPGLYLRPQQGADVTQVEGIVAAVAEVVAAVPFPDRTREAVTLLTELLRLYEIPPARYLQIAAGAGERLQRSIARIRQLAAPFARTG